MFEINILNYVFIMMMDIKETKSVSPPIHKQKFCSQSKEEDSLLKREQDDDENELYGNHTHTQSFLKKKIKLYKKI